MSRAICILCRTNDFAEKLYDANVSTDDLNPEVFSARRLPDRLHDTIYRCTQCGLVYPEKLIDPSILSALYEKSVYTYDNEEVFIRRTYKRYVKKAFDRLAHQPHPLSYMDIGCGNGFMLTAAKEVGFDEAFGIEPSEHAIQQADPSIKANIVKGMYGPDSFGGRKFDLITCFQTLDHIPDPVVFTETMFSMLKPDGLVLCINHNITSVTARILGERCPMIDIEHTYLHTPGSMHLMFDRAGYKNIDVFSVRNDYPLYMWMRLLPFPRKMKPGIIKWSKRLLFGHIIIPMYPGNLGLIGRRP
jgi:SAM-dependent methyltransferase